MKISFAEFEPGASSAVAVGVWEEGVLTAPARRLDEASGGAITRVRCCRVAALSRQARRARAGRRSGEPADEPHSFSPVWSKPRGGRPAPR